MNRGRNSKGVGEVIIFASVSKGAHVSDRHGSLLLCAYEAQVSLSGSTAMAACFSARMDLTVTAACCSASNC
jgi:hypothetical protein